MFQFAGFASRTYEFSAGYRLRGGLPHSEIHGSQPARGSPWLIATCYVLHRLSVPRHPPDALQTLDPRQRYAPRAGTSPNAHHTSPPQDALTLEPVRLNRPEVRPRSLTCLLHAVHDPARRPHRWGSERQAACAAWPTLPCCGSFQRTSEPSGAPAPRHQKTGGGRRDRTDDLLLAKQALSQLSYAPGRCDTRPPDGWWAREDLNLRPHAYQARALTN